MLGFSSCWLSVCDGLSLGLGRIDFLHGVGEHHQAHGGGNNSIRFEIGRDNFLIRCEFNRLLRFGGLVIRVVEYFNEGVVLFFHLQTDGTVCISIISKVEEESFELVNDGNLDSWFHVISARGRSANSALKHECQATRPCSIV